MDVPSPADIAWWSVRRVMDIHARVYRASGGRLGHHVPGAPPMLLLDTIGAKTLKQRSTPLAYFEDGSDVVIVASKGGAPKHPSWFHNLRAHPDTTVQIGSERREVHARVASPEERERLWPKAVELWADYANYQKRTEREIPLVVLEPRA